VVRLVRVVRVAVEARAVRVEELDDPTRAAAALAELKTSTASPPRRRRADGVEVDATILRARSP